MARSIRTLVLALLLAAAPAGDARAAGLGDLVLDAISRTAGAPAAPEETGFTEQTVRFTDLVGKRPVVILYWNPTAAASVEELVRYQAFVAGRPKTDMLWFAAVRALDDHERQAAERVLADRKIELPVLLDTQLELGRRMPVPFLPAYYGVDKAGRERLLGFSSLDDPTQAGGALRSALSDARDVPAVAPRRPQELAVGDIAPDFTLPDLRGHPVRLQDRLGKKPTMVLFWSPHCPHCRHELPRIQAWQNKRGEPFEILSLVRLLNPEDRVATERFVKEHGIEFPVLIDDGRVGHRYAIPGVPYWMILDAKGKVRTVQRGELPGLEGILRRWER